MEEHVPLTLRIAHNASASLVQINEARGIRETNRRTGMCIEDVTWVFGVQREMNAEGGRRRQEACRGAAAAAAARFRESELSVACCLRFEGDMYMGVAARCDGPWARSHSRISAR